MLAFSCPFQRSCKWQQIPSRTYSPCDVCSWLVEDRRLSKVESMYTLQQNHSISNIISLRSFISESLTCSLCRVCRNLLYILHQRYLPPSPSSPLGQFESLCQPSIVRSWIINNKFVSIFIWRVFQSIFVVEFTILVEYLFRIGDDQTLQSV
jgi:hypothetical protein